MKYKQIEQIRQACIKVNPSILDLKFGCRIKNKITGDINTVIDGNVFGGKILHWNWNINEARILTIEEIEILGRDITLEDILMAIKSKNTPMSIDVNGYFFIVSADLSNKHWHLTKSLQDQSDECIEFIFNLLTHN